MVLVLFPDRSEPEWISGPQEGLEIMLADRGGMILAQREPTSQKQLEALVDDAWAAISACSDPTAWIVERHST
jgi:hypothetical protein